MWYWGVPLLNFERGRGGNPWVPLLNFRGSRVTLLNFWVPGSQYDLMLLRIPEDVILQSHDYILLNVDNAEIP